MGCRVTRGEARLDSDRSGPTAVLGREGPHSERDARPRGDGQGGRRVVVAARAVGVPAGVARRRAARGHFDSTVDDDAVVVNNVHPVARHEDPPGNRCDVEPPGEDKRVVRVARRCNHTLAAIELDSDPRQVFPERGGEAWRMFEVQESRFRVKGLWFRV